MTSRSDWTSTTSPSRRSCPSTSCWSSLDPSTPSMRHRASPSWSTGCSLKMFRISNSQSNSGAFSGSASISSLLRDSSSQPGWSIILVEMLVRIEFWIIYEFVSIIVLWTVLSIILVDMLGGTVNYYKSLKHLIEDFETFETITLARTNSV